MCAGCFVGFGEKAKAEAKGPRSQLLEVLSQSGQSLWFYHQNRENYDNLQNQDYHRHWHH